MFAENSRLAGFAPSPSVPLASTPWSLRRAMTATSAAPMPTSMSRSDTFPSGVVGAGTPSTEAPHRIALYSREPRRIGVPPTKQQDQPRQLSMSPSRNSSERRRREQQQQEKEQPRPKGSIPSTAASSTKGMPGKLADQFLPWPSPDEIRKQRAQLLRPTGFGSKSNRQQAAQPQQPQKTQPETIPVFTSGGNASAASARPRAKSPPKMIKSVHSHELTPPPDLPPRRFRITVSPTRAKLDVSQEVEVQQPSQPKRFVIKQQVFTGSTSTFGGSSASGLERIGQLTAAGCRLNANQQQQYLQQAPRVEFGEDDSPRVEQPPQQSQQGRR